MLNKSLIALAVSSLLITGCGDSQQQAKNEATPPAISQNTSKTESESMQQSESEKANAMFERIFMERVMRSPTFQAWLGIKDNNHKWDDLSEENQAREHEFNKQYLAELKTLDASKLDPQTALSLKLAIQGMENSIADYKWRYHNYPLNQMRGMHSSAPSLLINMHSITEVKDAEAYIARLHGIKPLFAQVVDGVSKRAEMGIIAPKFVYPYIVNDSENLLKGAPFSEDEDSTLLADFKRKVAALEIEQAEKDKLVEQAKQALLESVKPAIEQLIAGVKKIEAMADSRDGAWKFPEGEAFYNNALARTTTTDLTAEEIHQIGLDEVARIHNEMRAIMKKVEFEGSLQDFFEFMRTDKQFYYPETEEGRQRYLDEATALIDTMKSRLDELFIIKPKADMVVKRVEAFREKSAGKAFYSSPSMDGSRPGIYYANLYRMSDMPTYQMEALAYHEGIPGHHMQLAIAQELEGIPKFRKFGGYTAYTEGWGLYSELVPKEIGMYSDPYSDFGRLAMELWRACRLVVDTGIHAMKWTREQGIDYYVTNTPNPKPDAVKMVERHIVMPSQATAYKIGMLKIVELREKAKTQLGDKFDIRQFHDVVLQNGPVPLNVLEEFVGQYIASNKS